MLPKACAKHYLIFFKKYLVMHDLLTQCMDICQQMKRAKRVSLSFWKG